ncbi:MAG: T9SS type A sorting domain-containing protein [Bacteroidales bacterium]|nr:T9SS type A sorting domain-containing protein [Bacteroidales bacterium]
MKKFTFTITVLLLLVISLNSHAQEWSVLNPSPTFNNLHAVSFPSPDTGYITGDNSSLLRTFDGGETWIALAFPIADVQLRSINFLNNNHGIIVAWSHIATTFDAGETWHYTHLQLYSDFIDSFFLNDTLVWVSNGDGTVLKSIDGGINWIQYNTQSNSYSNKEIKFFNADIGYIAGSYNSSSPVPKLRKTIDGGQTWVNYDVPQGIEAIADLSVLGENDIWIAANNHMVNNDSTGVVFKTYHSIDGGLSWATIEVGQSDGSNLKKINFFNALEGRLMSYSKIYETSDGGLTWANYEVGSSWNSTLSDFSWIDINNCAVVGYGPEITITKDGGQTWESKIHGTIGLFRSIYFLDENHGFTGGIADYHPVILKTEDSGNTWTNAQIDFAPGEDQINTITFSSPTTGWATTYGPYAYKTTDAGQSWQALTTGFDYNLTNISVPDDNNIFLAGGNAKMIKSNNGGSNWQEISPTVESGYYFSSGISFTDNLTGFVGVGNNYNRGDLLKTIDGGITWTALDYGYEYKIQHISFSDNNHGVIYIQGIGILVTEDGGNTWSAPVYVAPYLSSIKWIDTMHGIATYNDSYVGYTTDGGYTWATTYQQASLGGSIYSTYFIDEHIGWACGNNSLIMRYNETYIGIEPTIASKPIENFIYPNPANDVIHLQKDQYQKIQIFSIEGSLVQTYLPPFGESININALKSGMYTVEANTAQGTMRQKLLKK